MTIDTNRLLLELERAIREQNREIINPAIPEISLDDLCPVMRMAAQSRALYLKRLFELSNNNSNSLPTSEQVSELRELRETYEEMVAGAQALETAIQRGYLDVKQA